MIYRPIDLINEHTRLSGLVLLYLCLQRTTRTQTTSTTMTQASAHRDPRAGRRVNRRAAAEDETRRRLDAVTQMMEVR